MYFTKNDILGSKDALKSLAILEMLIETTFRYYYMAKMKRTIYLLLRI